MDLWQFIFLLTRDSHYFRGIFTFRALGAPRAPGERQSPFFNVTFSRAALADTERRLPYDDTVYPAAVPEGLPAMRAHSHELREAAFRLYSQGLSLRQVALRISETHHVRLDHSTVAAWVRRYNWRDRRIRLQHKAEQQADEKWTRDAASLLARLYGLRDNILGTAVTKSFKSAEGAVRSLATVQKVIASLLRPPDDIITLDQLEDVIAVVFQVFQQDEVLGPVLAQRETAVLAQIEACLAQRRDNADLGDSHVIPD
ncbi:hypothetical protein ACFL5M_05875 [Candidatus Neomarinimicrobiota bacterium]